MKSCTSYYDRVLWCGEPVLLAIVHRSSFTLYLAVHSDAVLVKQVAEMASRIRPAQARRGILYTRSEGAKMEEFVWRRSPAVRRAMCVRLRALRSDTPSAGRWSSELRPASGVVASTAGRSPPPLANGPTTVLKTYDLLPTATTPSKPTVTSNCCYTRACGPIGADSLRLRRPYTHCAL